MRALLVAAAALTICSASTHVSSAMLLQPHPGDALTQTELLAYLFTVPQSGDWVRYSISVGSNPLMVKTIGFGNDDTNGNTQAFFEISTQSSALWNAPIGQSSSVGGMVTWKSYVDAADFTDPLRRYTVRATALKIGDAFYRIESSSSSLANPLHVGLQQLLLAGIVPLQDARQGTVRSVQPQDVQLSAETVHCTDVTIDFPTMQLSGGAQLPAIHLEALQSSDVPLGTVLIRSKQMDLTYTVQLVAFGHGTYRSLITEPVTNLPRFPGST